MHRENCLENWEIGLLAKFFLCAKCLDSTAAGEGDKISGYADFDAPSAFCTG